MPYPHIDRLSCMLGYSVSLADEITRWMDSVANSLTDVANCITHARNSLNMTGKTGDAIEVNLDSLGKAILQHTDNIGILTSARRTVAEGARTAVSHANEVKNESNSIEFSHGGLTIENDTDSGQSSPASGSTSDSSTGPDPAQAAKMQALDAKAAKYLAQLSATTDAGIVKLAEIYPPDHSNSRGRGGGGHHAHSGIPESSGAPSGTVVPASVSPQHSAAVWQRGPDVMGPVGTPGASHPIGDHSPGGAGVSGPGVLPDFGSIDRFLPQGTSLSAFYSMTSLSGAILRRKQDGRQQFLPGEARSGGEKVVRYRRGGSAGWPSGVRDRPHSDGQEQADLHPPRGHGGLRCGDQRREGEDDRQEGHAVQVALSHGAPRRLQGHPLGAAGGGEA